MLILDHDLPQGALLGISQTNLAAQISALAGMWLHGDDEYVGWGNDGIVTATCLVGDAKFQRTSPNTGNQQAPGQGPGFTFDAGRHCGLVTEFQDGVGEVCTFAMRVNIMGEDALTLVTLNPDAQKNYVFVSHADQRLVIKDQRNTQELVCDLPPDITTLDLVVVIKNRQIAMQVNGGSVLKTTGTMDIDLTNAANVFLGCRNNRGGLLQTLGTFTLRDLFVLPEVDVFDVASVHTALMQYFGHRL